MDTLGLQNNEHAAGNGICGMHFIDVWPQTGSVAALMTRKVRGLENSSLKIVRKPNTTAELICVYDINSAVHTFVYSRDESADPSAASLGFLQSAQFKCDHRSTCLELGYQIN